MKTIPLSEILRKTVPCLVILAACGGCRFVDSYWRVHPESTVDGPSVFPTNGWGGYHPTQWRKWPEQGPRAQSPEPVQIPLSTKKPLPPPLLQNGGSPSQTPGISTPGTNGAALPPAETPDAVLPGRLPEDLTIPELPADPATLPSARAPEPTTGRMGENAPPATDAPQTAGTGSGSPVVTSPVGGGRKNGGSPGQMLPPTMLVDPSRPPSDEEVRSEAMQEAVRQLREEEEAKAIMDRRREELLNGGTTPTPTTAPAPLPPAL
ncbi:MAG: hypothetical protein Q4C47_07950, partial [Planctomycetia bacterium]|nr:hypothetical protein [Planctomycetia bacterium]